MSKLNPKKTATLQGSEQKRLFLKLNFSLHQKKKDQKDFSQNLLIISSKNK